MASSDSLDYLHASIIFSKSLLESYDLQLSIVILTVEYVFFLSEQVLYICPSILPKSRDKNRPIPILYNIERFVLLNKVGNEVVVANSSGELVYLEIDLNLKDEKCTILNHIILSQELAANHNDIKSMIFNEYYKLILVEFLHSNDLYYLHIPSYPEQLENIHSNIFPLNSNNKTASNNNSIHISQPEMGQDALVSIWGNAANPCLVYTYPSLNSYLYFHPLTFSSNNSTIESKPFYRRRALHKAYINSLSSLYYTPLSFSPTTLPSLTNQSQRELNYNLNENDWAITGDLTGHLCIWQYSNSNSTDPSAASLPSRAGKWKLLWIESFLFNNHPIDLIQLSSDCYHSNNKTAYIADRSGKITTLHVSLRHCLCYAQQTLQLFPTGFAISSMCLYPIESGQNIRLYSASLGEGVECSLSKHIASIFRVWPESHLFTCPPTDPLSNSCTAHSLPLELSTTRALHTSTFPSLGPQGGARQAVQVSTLLPYGQLLVVADYTANLLFYDLHSNLLVYTLEGIGGQVSVLGGWDRLYSSTSTLTLCAGHRDGTVVIYQIRMNIHTTDVVEIDEETVMTNETADSASLSQSLSLPLSSAVSLADSLMIDQPLDRPVYDLINEDQPALAIDKDAAPPALAPPPPSQSVYRLPPIGSSSMQITHTIMHVIRPNASPVTDMFISRLGRELVVIYQRRVFYSYLSLLLANKTYQNKKTNRDWEIEKENEEEDDVEEEEIKVEQKEVGKRGGKEGNKQLSSTSNAKKNSSNKNDNQPQSKFSAKNTSVKAEEKKEENRKSVRSNVYSNTPTPRRLSTAPLQTPRLSPLENFKELTLDQIQNHISELHSLPTDPPSPSVDANRLLLILQSSYTIKLLDALTLTILTNFSIESALSLPSKHLKPTSPTQSYPTQTPHKTKKNTAVGKIVIWDYNTSQKGIAEEEKEHGLVGLYGQDLFTWMSFSDQAGFKYLHDIHSQLNHVYQSNDKTRKSKVDRFLWRMTGYNDEQSPILMACSMHYMVLYRMQLDHHTGPMIMRTKLFALNYTPTRSKLASTDYEHLYRSVKMNFEAKSNEVLLAQALPLLPKVRYHQAIIVLASGFAFVVKL